MYCPRCDDAVAVIAPWPGWRAARTAWWVVLGIVLIVFPVAAADYCVMLPSFMAYLMAGGPIRAHAKTKPVCRCCSLELDENERGGTLVRPR